MPLAAVALIVSVFAAPRWWRPWQSNPRGATCDGSLLPTAGALALQWLVPLLFAAATCAMVLLLRRETRAARELRFLARSPSFVVGAIVLLVLVWLQLGLTVMASEDIAGLLPTAQICHG